MHFQIKAFFYNVNILILNQYGSSVHYSVPSFRKIKGLNSVKSEVLTFSEVKGFAWI